MAIPVELPSSESDTQTFVETNSKKDIKNYNLLLYVFSVHVGLVDTDSFDYHIIMWDVLNKIIKIYVLVFIIAFFTVLYSYV